ncbi:cobalamin biosynthesis protein [Nocardia takedensis]|uniref:cobalamin biosynthesis protein n=1 Tax=Nocardia takedensis TaxID=259390 RepID=UPI0002D96DB6|nr:cobalamin biosynthesis protein [Nocardia takedensis]
MCSDSALESAPTAERAPLVVGLGLRPDTSAARIVAAIREALGECVIGAVATLDRRAAEPGVREAAVLLGVPVLAFAAETLAGVDVPNPGRRTRAAVGTGSVAEAAAILAARAPLTHPKRVVDGIVVAAATRR